MDPGPWGYFRGRGPPCGCRLTSSFFRALLPRAPTLSYTKQLEARVAQLEDALSKLRGQQADLEARKGSSPASVAESSSSAGRKIKIENDETQDLARDFDGLNVETDGRISFHGPTSLFQLPSGVVNETASTADVAQELEARKERLINSAWRERAFEQMAAMPVRSSCGTRSFGVWG